MSTGLTFGTISALFGLSHGIISQGQYSALVAAVIGSAVIPTVIANAFYLPYHLLPTAKPCSVRAEAGVFEGGFWVPRGGVDKPLRAMLAPALNYANGH
jgi:hypothetical protein